MWSKKCTSTITVTLIFGCILSLCNADLHINKEKTTVQVTLSDGILEGDIVDNEFGGQFYSFKGIPYAQPPVGDLRFKAPQPLGSWEGIRSARDFGPICYQPNTNNTASGSEDCLYLNVYSPELKPKALIPVMVWIHGGAFVSGSGNDDIFGPEFLVRQGVILVTLNYRVGALGLLSLNTEDIPGNAGMKDQVAALRWVKKNIGKFGGNPENVTIFGESAGAGSVGYHLVSPMTKGLFQRAIAQSGAASCWWAQSFEPREKAILLANNLGFHSNDDKELYNFFKSLPAESLVNLKLPIIMAPKLYDIDFAITDEKKFGDNERFFYGDVYEALKNGIHEDVEIMAGYNDDEGLIAIPLSGSLDRLVNQANNFLEFFVPLQIKYKSSLSKQLEVGRKMKKFYFNNEIVSSNNIDQLHKFLDFDMFAHGITLLGTINRITNKNKIYMYKFTCKTERNSFARILGLSEEIIGNKNVTCHGDDLLYLFPTKLVPQKIDMNSEVFQIIDRVTKLWTNFAKYGNPTPDESLGVNWTPYTTENQDYLNIGNQLSLGPSPDEETIQFWNDIFREYFPESGI